MFGNELGRALGILFWLAILGIIALVAALGFGGYLLYQFFAN